MQVNLEKSHIMAIEVELLGFILTRTGAKPTPKRIEAILKLATSKNVRGCRRIIRIINFIKNHIPMYVALMQYLTELTRKDTKFKWDIQRQKDFNKLKAAVANSILIIYPDPTKPFTYYSDASQKCACGGLLCQKQEGVEVVVGCNLKKWTSAELICPVGKQELAAGHKGMRYFDNIVQGCDVLMRMDHLNNTFNEPGGQNVHVTRQMVELDSKYGVKFEHLLECLTQEPTS